MKKNILLVLLFLILTCGCATTKPPALNSSEQTITVFPILVFSDSFTTQSLRGGCRLLFQNVETSRKLNIDIATYNKDFIFKKNIPEGKYRLLCFYDLNNKKYNMQFEQLLIVKEGTLSICPFKLSLFTYKNKFSCSQLNTFYFYTKVTEIKHKEMVSIKSAIKKLYDNP